MNTFPKDIKAFKSTGYTGAWLSRALFLEQYYTSPNPDKESVLFTLQPQDREVDGVTYLSLGRLYIELGDLTEYLFATTYLGGWDHWLHLQQCEWLKPYIAKWRTELELKTQAEALQRMKEEALSDGRNAFQVNRFLVSKGWIAKDADPDRRGRPSKAEIKQEATRMAEKFSKAEEDFKRIMDLN